MITRQWTGTLRNLSGPIFGLNPSEIAGSIDFVELIGYAFVANKAAVLSPTAFAAGVAAAAYLNIYTVTAALRPYVKRITVSASVSARYSLEYNGVVIWSNHLLALQPHSIEWADKGYFNNTPAALFRIQNNGAGAADIAVSMALNEV